MKGYRTSFGSSGDLATHEFETKAENDQFASEMEAIKEMVGIKIILKEFYNPNIGNWYRYHNDRPEDQKYEDQHKHDQPPLNAVRKGRRKPSLQGHTAS